MTNHLNSKQKMENERILSRVEQLGGGYVWDAEVFAVSLEGVAVSGMDVRALLGLVGVEQIALNCSCMPIATLKEIAAIPGLKSLVLCNSDLRLDELKMLQSLGPDVEMLNE